MSKYNFGIYFRSKSVWWVCRGYGFRSTRFHQFHHVSNVDGREIKRYLELHYFINLTKKQLENIIWYTLGTDPEQEILQAFECFDDKHTGAVDADELREYLTTMGDRFTDDEVIYTSSGYDYDVSISRLILCLREHQWIPLGTSTTVNSFGYWNMESNL